MASVFFQLIAPLSKLNAPHWGSVSCEGETGSTSGTHPPTHLCHETGVLALLCPMASRDNCTGHRYRQVGEFALDLKLLRYVVEHSGD